VDERTERRRIQRLQREHRRRWRRRSLFVLLTIGYIVLLLLALHATMPKQQQRPLPPQVTKP
jgi:hypothetical protein